MVSVMIVHPTHTMALGLKSGTKILKTMGSSGVLVM
jgi:hypothetical protein